MLGIVEDTYLRRDKRADLSSKLDNGDRRKIDVKYFAKLWKRYIEHM